MGHSGVSAKAGTFGVGIDFGTTNSSIAIADSGGVRLARFANTEGFTESYRSLLYLEKRRTAGRTTIRSWSGPEGIERYLQADDHGRLIQSLKSFLASRGLQSTEVFGIRIQIEDLIARILEDIRVAAEGEFGPGISRSISAGVPVRFVGADSADDNKYAIARLETAFKKSGFDEIHFEFEPVAAAYHYEAGLDHDELILIGDFGGGSSDFSLLRVGPSVRKNLGRSRQVIGNEGVPIAGDAFDAKIIRHLVCPALGAGTQLRSGGKLLPVPNWVYFKLERWHHLSFLKSHETLNMLRGVEAQSLEREKLKALLYLIRHDLGYHLHRAVQRTKVELSHSARSIFSFADGEVELEAEVKREEFESWISEELLAIRRGIHDLLQTTGVDPKEVDAVFLTGGSSLVPAVQNIFAEKFGAGKIRTGDEFTSVARGLALQALERNR